MITHTSTPHEIPSSLIPQNKPQTPPISSLHRNSQVLLISVRTAVYIPDLSNVLDKLKAIMKTYQNRNIIVV